MLNKEYPLISVIIPCYNVAGYVEKAISSILSQTYTNIEVIVVDDASTDNTLEKIKSFDDKRIKLLEMKENTKKIGAVNEALKKASGQLIAFQDADDWSEPNRIEEQLKQFKYSVDLGVCFTKYKVNNSKKSQNVRVAMNDTELKDEFLMYGNRKYSHLAPTMCATMMITRAVLNETKGYHPYFAGRVAEDAHWIYRILKNFKGITVNANLYTINLRKGSLTQLQLEGKNVKAAYSWRLLSQIIAKDVNDKIYLLDPSNMQELKEAELIACEEALIENINLLNDLKLAYESSYSYRIGKLLLAPIRLFRKLKRSNF